MENVILALKDQPRKLFILQCSFSFEETSKNRSFLTADINKVSTLYLVEDLHLSKYLDWTSKKTKVSKL